MGFEYDENKSKSNLIKHGIDFETAKQLWNDSGAVLLISGNSGNDYMRNLYVAQLDGIIYTAIITTRGENIRIISVRHARESEREAYYGAK
jgi:uncharacterized DUF497 family protein